MKPIAPAPTLSKAIRRRAMGFIHNLLKVLLKLCSNNTLCNSRTPQSQAEWRPSSSSERAPSNRSSSQSEAPSKLTGASMSKLPINSQPGPGHPRPAQLEYSPLQVNQWRSPRLVSPAHLLTSWSRVPNPPVLGTHFTFTLKHRDRRLLLVSPLSRLTSEPQPQPQPQPKHNHEKRTKPGKNARPAKKIRVGRVQKKQKRWEAEQINLFQDNDLRKEEEKPYPFHQG